MQIKPILKTVFIVLCVLFCIWLLLQLLFGAAESATYAHVFRLLTTEGGVNAWLARAVTVLFVAAVAYGFRLLFSMKKQRRTTGWLVLAGGFVAFNVLMYACTRSMTTVEEGQHFVTTTGDAKSWYLVSEDGDWELFPYSGYHPRTGEKLKPMTTEAAKEYEAWNRKKAEQAENQAKAEDEHRIKKALDDEKQAKAEAERRFRESNINERAIALRPGAAEVLLALKADGSDVPVDFLQGQIANLLATKQKNPVSGAFKAAFYKDGPFDEFWNGDLSAAERLHLFDGASNRLLLAKATFSNADKTEFDGILSVQGSIAIILLDKDRRSGPWTYNASGVGNKPKMAVEACAKRLVEAIDLGAIFPE